MTNRRKAVLPDLLTLFGGGLGTYLFAYVVIAIFAIRPTLRLDFWLLGCSAFAGTGALLFRSYWRSRHLNDQRRGFSVDPPRQ